MEYKKTLLMLVTLLAVFALSINIAGAKTPYSVDYVDELVLLMDSGAPEKCANQNDFMVWNRGNKAAEIEVILGGETLLFEVIDPNEKRFYSRDRSFATAQLKGAIIGPGESLTVVNSQHKPDIRLHCLE